MAKKKQKLKKLKKTNKNYIILLLLIVFILIGAALYHIQINNKSTSFKKTTSQPTPTEVKQNLDELIQYTVPDNWTRTYDSRYPHIGLISRQNSQDGFASITISRYPKISFSIQNAARKIDGIESDNRFSYTDGSGFDTYLVEKDGYIWKIMYECRPNCTTKELIDQSPYAKDRDAILNSIKLK